MNSIIKAYIYALGFWFATFWLASFRLALTQIFSTLLEDLDTKKPDLSKENLNNSILIVIANVALIAFLFQTLINSVIDVLISHHVYLIFGLIYPYLFLLPLIHIVLVICIIYVWVMTGAKLAYGLAASDLNDKAALFIIVTVLFFSLAIGILSIN